jgi:hypothetical protein
LNQANRAYAKDHPHEGYARRLTDFAWHSANPTQRAPEWAIDSELANGEKSKYRFTYRAGSSSSDGKVESYSIEADPLNQGRTGRRHFFVDETGVIRVSENSAANAMSAPRE